MNSFPSEVISFISQIRPNYELEPWGLFLSEANIGFVFHSVVEKEDTGYLIPEDIKKVHIWEDHWLLRKEIVQARINSLFNLTTRVFARKTTIIKLHKPELLAFLKENHLNEPANGKFKYGLLFGDELVAVALFSASCPIHRGDEVFKSHQLIRFCNKNGLTVVGGLSKLIAHFIKEQSPEDIMTYADLDWSNGGGYIKIGFEKIGELAPQPFSIHSDSNIRNYKFDTARENEPSHKFFNQGSAKYLLDLKKRGQ